MLLPAGCSTERTLEVEAIQPTPWRAQIGARLEDGLTSETLKIGGTPCVDLIRPANVLTTHASEIRQLRGRIVERRGWPRPDREGEWVDVPGDTVAQAVTVRVCGP
jgi:hypothetical protein